MGEASTPFDFAAVEAAVDGPAVSPRSLAVEFGAVAMGKLLDALIAERSAKGLGIRAVALALALDHWTVRGVSVRAAARQFGISHTALNNALDTLPEPFNRRAIHARKLTVRTKAKPPRRFPRAPLGK